MCRPYLSALGKWLLERCIESSRNVTYEPKQCVMHGGEMVGALRVYHSVLMGLHCYTMLCSVTTLVSEDALKLCGFYRTLLGKTFWLHFLPLQCCGQRRYCRSQLHLLELGLARPCHRFSTASFTHIPLSIQRAKS